MYRSRACLFFIELESVWWFWSNSNFFAIIKKLALALVIMSVKYYWHDKEYIKLPTWASMPFYFSIGKELYLGFCCKEESKNINTSSKTLLEFLLFYFVFFFLYPTSVWYTMLVACWWQNPMFCYIVLEVLYLTVNSVSITWLRYSQTWVPNNSMIKTFVSLVYRAFACDSFFKFIWNTDA